MPISYDPPTNTITVTGYTEATPCTFLDIWNADQGGGWGVVSKQGDDQFMFDCRIIIGDGSTETWFADTKKQVTFSSLATTANGQNLFYVESNAHFRLGELVDAASKTTRMGCSVLWINTDNRYFCRITRPASATSDINLFSSTFRVKSSGYYPDASLTVQGKAYNLILDRVNFGGERSDYQPAVVDAYRITTSDSRYGFVYGTTGTFNDFTILKNNIGIYFYASFHVTFRNVRVVKGASYAVQCLLITYDKYLINAEIDNWTVNFDGACTKAVYRQYEFDAHCQDKEGGDLSGVSAVGEYVSPYGQAFSQTTDGNGDIPTQTVDHGFFDQAHGSTEQLKTPLKVTYSKPGYQTVVKYHSMDEKTVDRVVLHKAVRVFEASKPVINLKRTDPENKKVLVL
jgi:hypothetical protein